MSLFLKNVHCAIFIASIYINLLILSRIFLLCSPATLLLNDVSALMKAVGKQLKDKSLKTRVGIFMVLHELAKVAPHSTVDHIPGLIQGLQKGLMVGALYCFANPKCLLSSL